MSDNSSLLKNGQHLKGYRIVAETAGLLDDPAVQRCLDHHELSLKGFEQLHRDKASNMPILRGGASEAAHTAADDHGDFEDDFERTYDELLKLNADACADSTPSPCAEAWMRMASLLQMRNSYLEHLVRELQETNDSLAGDVDWHVEALERLEELLREAQVERAAALADVLDLRVRVACMVECDAALSAADKESVYTDMTDSGSTTPSLSCSEDSVVRCNNAASDITFPHAPFLKPCPPAASSKHLPVRGFYFYPSSSTITLPTSPPESFQWLPGTTLHGIRDNLISRHERGIEDNIHLATILEIMDERETMGVRLPGPTRDSVIWIDVPDVHGVPSKNNGVEIDAWASFDSDMVFNGYDLYNVDYPSSNRPWDTDCAGEMKTPETLGQGHSDDSSENVYPEKAHPQRHDKTRCASLDPTAESTPPALRPREYVGADSDRVGSYAESTASPSERHGIEKSLYAWETCIRCGMPDLRLHQLAISHWASA